MINLQETDLKLNPPRRAVPRVTIALMLAFASLIVVAVLLVRIMRQDAEATVQHETSAAQHAYSPLRNSAAPSRLSYGNWEGEIRYSQPHGQGTLTYTERRLISQFDPEGRVACPGDYVIGEFDCGQLVQGKLYRTDGSVEEIIPSRR